MSSIRWYGPTLLLLGTLVLAMLVGPGMVRQIAKSYEGAQIEQVRKDLVENPTLLTLSDAFKDVARVVRPSVTSISLLAREPRLGRLEGISNGSGWVYRYFPDFDADPGTYTDYIITNNHVVEDLARGRAEQAVVRFDDGGEYRATIVGTDPKTDIAVLKINRTGLIPAALATDPAVQGEIVFAVGSPFQFEFSMSQGIVSATGRRLHDARINSYENYIQTDAAINPGNSGGPLTNVRGEVIGMNTAIAVEGNPQATFSGLGFAIPIDLTVNVVNQLIENGEVERGYIGVFVNDVDFATKQELGFDGDGVLCEPVPGGPAEKAGMQVGDIVTHVGGKAVGSAEELRIAVSSHPPGSEVPVRVWRDGRVKTLRLQLVEDPREAGAPTQTSRLDNPFESGVASPATAAGLSRFETFTPGLAARLGWAYTPGVLIRLIEDGSSAERFGVQRMSIITAVQGTPIRDLETFAQALGDVDGDTLGLTLKQWNPLGEGRYEAREVQLDTR
ncbi:MAG: trypsin-like peptidase domain-containing protein [Phycisphaeraceae bacterium]|nr:trypsin-like peptidase domain-containing protein [Phycisphaeraceae bacterium]